MRMTIFWAACTVLVAVPPYFVWNAVYRDGVLGRAALLAISFVSLSFMLEETLSENERTYDMLPQTVALVAAFAVFLLWHLWRFHRRVMRHGRCPPDCPIDRRKVAERRFTA